MEHKKYPSIPRINKARHLERGEEIYVFEKIDGANASIVNNNGEIEIFSRNNYIAKPETFRGFRHWCEAKEYIECVPTNLRLFGEWVVRHKINYNKDVENTFVLFDILDEDTGEFYSMKDIMNFAEFYEFKTPELLYHGEFISIEHLGQFVGKTSITEEMKGEGIVIRAKDYISKWVREDFQETRIVKAPKEINFEMLDLFKQLCTGARVEKVMHKGVDEGIYTDFKSENFGKLMPYVVRETMIDIFKEEVEIINGIEDKVGFEKICKAEIPKLIKKIGMLEE